MADRYSTTISDSDWFLLGFEESPGDVSTTVLSRAVSGLSREEAYAIRTARTGNNFVENPYVDGTQWTGTWKVKSATIRPVNEGTDAGSFMYVETIQYGSYSSCLDENEVLGRSQSEPYEQNEYGWMFYEWQVFDEVKSWYNIPKDYIQRVQAYMKKIFKTSGSGTGLTIPGLDVSEYVDIGNLIVYAEESGSISFTSGFNPSEGYGYDIIQTLDGRIVYQTTSAAVFTKGKYYLFNVTRDGTTPDCVGDAGCGWGNYPQYKLTLEELTQPQISRCYIEEANDGTYRINRSLRSYSSDYFLKTRGFKYYGLVTVKGAPLLDDSQITLQGFSNETEVIHKHARFQIGGDVYRVTADATAVGGEVTLSITPTITQATENLCDEYTNQIQSTFLAMR